MGAEVRPELPDGQTDTGGITPLIKFTKLGELMLVTDEKSATDVTGIPAETPAPFAEQHDDSQSSLEPHRFQARHEGLGPRIAQVVKLNRERDLRKST